jgi:hypothetical protein
MSEQNKHQKYNYQSDVSQERNREITSTNVIVVRICIQCFANGMIDLIENNIDLLQFMFASLLL